MSLPATHFRPFRRNHSNKFGNREERCYTSKTKIILEYFRSSPPRTLIHLIDLFKSFVDKNDSVSDAENNKIKSDKTGFPVERKFCHEIEVLYSNGDRFNSCQVIYSQFGLVIHQNDHQARRRFVEWAQNEIAVVPDFYKRILFSDEAHFWLNGYLNKQNCRIWSEANPQVYVETPLHPEKLTVWCALWAGGILLQKR
ncbi:uncharacterized protein TNCV_2959231 [Trichonephila clavipes]|nr:uncharacterized protein TNCV_2959231 [Trichonephila clavipes]